MKTKTATTTAEILGIWEAENYIGRVEGRLGNRDVPPGCTPLRRQASTSTLETKMWSTRRRVQVPQRRRRLIGTPPASAPTADPFELRRHRAKPGVLPNLYSRRLTLCRHCLIHTPQSNNKLKCTIITIYPLVSLQSLPKHWNDYPSLS